MKTSIFSFAVILFAVLSSNAQPIPIGSKLELLADHYLIESLDGSAALKVHEPVPREVALITDAPWEGNTSAYYTVFQDGDIYRMYYRGAHVDEAKKSVHPEVACYAESRDGITWTKPGLGVIEWEGSKDNNIVWTGAGSHNFTPFLDTNPATPAHQKYRALGRVGKFRTASSGLRAFESADGAAFKITRDEPVITDGAFDSQNLAFWDAHNKEYRAYWRIFTNKVRAIRTATSKDFLTWENQADLTYPEGTPNQHLYTNATQPYFRAPHLFIGFPTRYLPDEDSRVEPIFMISRDGVHFTRHNDPVVPESAPKDRAGNRSNYMANGILSLPGKPDELSVYASEAYYTGPDSRLRRFTYRLDGFVSLNASDKPGTLLSKTLTFNGDTLTFNAAVAKGGNLRVEIQDPAGKTLAASTPVKGDNTAHQLEWKSGADLAGLAGKPVRLRILLKDADLYSFQFK